MSFKEDYRVFFISYDNGLVFYFNINKQGEIFCREFIKLFGNMNSAYYLVLTNDGFVLQDKDYKKIYSLEDYIVTFRKNSLFSIEEPMFMENLYIDEDVMVELLEMGKLKFNENVYIITGLVNSFTKKMVK